MTSDEMTLYKWQDAQEMRPARVQNSDNGSQGIKLIKKLVETLFL